MTKQFLISVAALAVFLLSAMQSPAADGWLQVNASEPFTDRHGKARAPSCSGAPMPPAFNTPSPTEFSFFYREGNAKNLVIAFDGGGACWDAQTCLGSVVSGNAVYDPIVDETTDSLDELGGLGDRNHPENPAADALQVLIPYCTGDLHTGSRDTVYTLPGRGAFTIHHRGFDNVAAVLAWIEDYYTYRVGEWPENVFITGASAGGYGAFFAYPAIDELLPSRTRKRVVSDSAIGIIHQDFYDRALTPEGVWGIWENVPPPLANAFASGPAALPIAINQSLAWQYPRTRFGQYTRAFDAVQIFYLNVAKHLSAPELWNDPLRLFITGIEWTARARASLGLSALTTWNYRYYLAEGIDHTVVADDHLYVEASGGGRRLIDWLDDMINRRWAFGGDWRNASCFPGCLP